MDYMMLIGWTVVIGLFVVGMAGAIFPVLPGVLSVVAGFVAYGLFFDFSPFGVWFWVLQAIIVALVIIAEYIISSLAVKKVGGSNDSVKGTNIGLILGPFLIPVFGILIGPLLGAMLGEMKHSQDWRHVLKVGVSSVVGYVISVVIKLVLQLIMIILFIIWLWMAPDLANTTVV